MGDLSETMNPGDQRRETAMKESLLLNHSRISNEFVMLELALLKEY